MTQNPKDYPKWGEFFRADDSRGSWSRSFEAEIFEALALEVAQTSVSRTTRSGTLRGLHSMQLDAQEWKLVSCVAGEVWDVVVDVAAAGENFGAHHSARMSGKNGDWVLIPPGYAHGFVTLSDEVVMAYTMSAAYQSDREEGYRYDDPVFGIRWPIGIQEISNKDRSFPLVKRVTP